MSDRIEREKRTVKLMLSIYCADHHNADMVDSSVPFGELCDSCGELFRYSVSRLDHCPHGSAKRSCKVCPAHCYRPLMRDQIRAVMRYSGPRMLFRAPIATLRHLLG